jgi:hypothetical protein
MRGINKSYVFITSRVSEQRCLIKWNLTPHHTGSLCKTAADDTRQSVSTKPELRFIIDPNKIGRSNNVETIYGISTVVWLLNENRTSRELTSMQEFFRRHSSPDGLHNHSIRQRAQHVLETYGRWLKVVTFQIKLGPLLLMLLLHCGLSPIRAQISNPIQDNIHHLQHIQQSKPISLCKPLA